MGVQAAGERDGREPALWRSRLRLHVLTRCRPSVQASAHARQEPMMAETIAFVLRNLPVFLFVAALVFAWLSRSARPSLIVCSAGSCSCRSASRAYGRPCFIFSFLTWLQRTSAGS